MQIACIGWASLIWDPGKLLVETQPCPEDAWRTDGPWLPIEFARLAKLNLVKAVLVPGVPESQTLWSVFKTQDLEEARRSLAKREGIPEDRAHDWVGHWNGGDAANAVEGTVGDWARQRDLDAALWINLPPRWANTGGVVPSQNQVIDHLSSLQGEDRRFPEKYIRKTPRQVKTPFRSAIESALGWTPLGRV